MRVNRSRRLIECYGYKLRADRQQTNYCFQICMFFYNNKDLFLKKKDANLTLIGTKQEEIVVVFF